MKTISERYYELMRTDKYSEEGALEKAFHQAKHQEYKRMHLIYEHVRMILKHDNAYFITLTYNDDHLNEGKTENAKKWAQKHLLHYIGNDDYGTKNGRYHHHVLGNMIEQIDLNASWKYGAINVKKIHTKDAKAIGKYIARLKNHAVKKSTASLFRSRKKKTDDQR